MKNAFRIPIAFKLIAVTVVLLLTATIPIAFKAAEDFESKSGDRERNFNREQAIARAAEVDSLIQGYLDKIKMVADVVIKEERKSEQLETPSTLSPAVGSNANVEGDKAKLQQSPLFVSFYEDRELLSVEAYVQSNDKVEKYSVVNEDSLKNYLQTYSEEIRPNFLSEVKGKNFTSELLKYYNDENNSKELVVIRNLSSAKVPMITVAFPLADNKGIEDNADNMSLDEKTQGPRYSIIVVAYLKVDRLQAAFSSAGERDLFLVDSRGVLLADPKVERVLQRIDMKATEESRLEDSNDAGVGIVSTAQASIVKKGEVKYTIDNKAFFGAYAKTRYGATVISQASEEKILAHAKMVRRKAFYITGLSLSAAFFFIFLFSMTLTGPLEKLVYLTKEISRGNFEVSAKAVAHSSDEVGELAQAFDEMTAGLKERDKVKMLFSKFHGSSVAEDMINRDIEVGGSRKTVAVFFSDIRGFTKFSENRTPEEVVEMLNEYFAMMVAIINRHGGIVDKFIGDAIMAIWGAPRSTQRDAQNAMKACLDMRVALNVLNEKRIARGQEPIKIGMGLHWGDAISGTIGSDERMEYTVIGDTVNMASRIEASTKAFGTDLLVSEHLAEHVKDEFILDPAGAAEVKGKTEALKLFRVKGFYDEAGKPIQVSTPYSTYQAERADKIKVAS